jgi:Na+/H+ antiporter NhaD/arsenite permease-like protein
MNLHVAIPLTIFALTYLVIAVGRIPPLSLDRTGAALVGAVAMVISGVLSEHAAEAAVDFRTLALLLGMMIVVANLRLSGAFALAARSMLAKARSGFGLLAVTVAVSGVLAAFFINDVVCLALTPLLIETATELEVDPVPLLLGLATASNIGSSATITGNPQNMIVAGFAHLRYSPFALHLAPPAAIGLAIDYAVIAFVYRRALAASGGHPESTSFPRPRVIRALLIKSALIAFGALVCFALGFETDLVALAAGALLLFTRRIRPERVYELVDWTMLVMFAGLFIVVAGAEATGFQNELIRIVGVSRLANPVALAIAVAVLSNLVSNVPAVLLFRPLYPLLGVGEKGALVLASASTLAGNLTVVGSIANLIVIEQARRHRIDITFSDYLRVGVPVTIITIVIGLVFLRFA